MDDERHPFNPLLITLLVILLLLLVACTSNGMHIAWDPADSGRRPPESLRVMTWNVAMLPGLIGRLAGHEPADAERVHRVCDEILTAAPDVVVLQEVFDEDARRVLSERLRTVYPYRVEKCGAGGLMVEDSGLFFASKHRVLPGSEVFEAFSHRGGLLNEERLASKGIFGAWVELSHGRAVGIFNTHLQADGDRVGAFAGVRRRQLAQIRKLIERSVARAARTHEVYVLLLGDLNVVGETVDAVSTRLCATQEYIEAVSMLPEATDLVRARAPDRPLYTWEPPQESKEPHGQRLDYVLALCGGPAQPLICRGVELTRRGRGKLLSDHRGIVVDLDVGA